MIAYVDLGSCCTTIKKTIAEHLGCVVEPSNTVLKGFGGNKIQALGKIYTSVEWSTVKANIELIIVDDSAQDVPVIIGRNYLDREGIELVKKVGTFEIKQMVRIMEIEEISPKSIEKTDITINSEIGDDLVNNFIILLNEYRNAFALTMDEIQKTDLIEMEIKLNSNQVVNYRPYKVPYGLKKTLQSQIDLLLKLGIIQNSSSEYSSPVLLVPKKNGEYRLCVDYRKLNSRTKKENFPVPNIEETLNSLGNKRYFTNLDLLSGYHQIPIAEQSTQYTGFVTPTGHYEYTCMPFGLSNAPAIFMRLMRKICDRVKSLDIIVYLDDILISTVTVDEHISLLKKILNEICKANLKLNIAKCNFMQTEINFLGHMISCEGIRPGANKSFSVENYKTPKNVKEIRQFLGLSGYFRRFVPDFSKIARPLSELLKKDAVFNWTSEREHSFNKLKEILSKRPLLAIYDVNSDHEVHTDASSHGLAGILMQRDQSKNIRPVSYFSRCTTEPESKYHSYELEALAVVESLERCKYYLLNKHFKVITDCDSLRFTKEKKTVIPRIARWWLKIAEYDFDMEYRSNKKMTHVDALSRCPLEPGKTAETIAEKMFLVGIERED